MKIRIYSQPRPWLTVPRRVHVMTIVVLLICLLSAPAAPPNNETLGEAVRLYESGRYSQAVSVLQQLVATTPTEAEGWVWLSKSLLKTRSWDRAVRAMERAVQLQPANAEYRLLLGRALGQRASHSNFLTAMNWARRVLKEFETARKLAPDSVDVRFDLLEYYLEAPGFLGGGKEKAEAEALAIEKLNPQKGFLARATIHIKNKEWGRAQQELQRAVAEYPNVASAHKDLAEFLFERQDFEGALRYARQALTLDRKSKRSMLIAASAQVRLRVNLEESVRTLRELLQGPLGDGDPSFEEVYYWLGEYHLVMGEKSKAKEAFESALTYNPEFNKAKEGLSKSK